MLLEALRLIGCGVGSRLLELFGRRFGAFSKLLL
jgi:hypothetical protein